VYQEEALSIQHSAISKWLSPITNDDGNGGDLLTAAELRRRADRLTADC